jgi:uncharacterized membrane protein YccC
VPLLSDRRRSIKLDPCCGRPGRLLEIAIALPGNFSCGMSGSTRLAPPRSLWAAARCLKTKDPDLLAIKRSVRAAVVMPSVFGLTHLLFSNPQIGLFGSFGSFALLLLVDFPGRPRTRLVSYVVLCVVGSCLIALGTVASTHKLVAVVAMAVVGFAVLFAGIVSPQAANAATAAIVTFVLPVSVAQPAAAVGPRLVGWALAGAFCIPSCMLIWPSPWHDNLRRRLSATVSAVSQLAAARAEGRADADVLVNVRTELSLLKDQFSATSYPPTGAAAGAVAVAKLVGRVEWVCGNAALLDETASVEPSPVRRIFGTVAETLRLSALLVCDGSAHLVDDPTLVQALRESTRRLDKMIEAELDERVSTLIGPETELDAATSSNGDAPESAARRGSPAFTLDPTFRARALGIATEMVADATLEAAGSEPEVNPLGPSGEGSSRMLRRRLASYLSFRSVWFRNSLRGAAGLALAVAVVEFTNVEHGFWVVLGALSVLRSNALGTGSTALRAVGGTAVGFVVGSAIMIGVAGHAAALWAILPFAVLVSGVAPSMISFAAGQAGFTVVVVILFNIIQPVGW